MERYEDDPVGFEFDGIWITRSISKIIRFRRDPLCDHLEVNVGREWPMAYVLDEDGYLTLEAYEWDVCTYEEANEQMKEFIISLHMENQPTELLKWYSENP